MSKQQENEQQDGLVTTLDLCLALSLLLFISHVPFTAHARVGFDPWFWRQSRVAQYWRKAYHLLGLRLPVRP